MCKNKILTVGIILLMNLHLYGQGNVGIGTDSPQRKLHIYRGSAGPFTSSGNTTAVFESNTDNYLSMFSPAISETGILFGNPANAASGGIVYNSGLNGNGLQFRTNGNVPRMFLDSIGNLGLNVPVPQHRLDVSGSSFFRNGNFGFNHYASNVSFNIRGQSGTKIFRIEDNAGGNILEIDEGGRLGYGQVFPEVSFSIVPNIEDDWALFLSNPFGFPLMEVRTDERFGFRALDNNTTFNFRGRTGFDIFNIENEGDVDILKIDESGRFGFRGGNFGTAFNIKGAFGLANAFRVESSTGFELLSLANNGTLTFDTGKMKVTAGDLTVTGNVTRARLRLVPDAINNDQLSSLFFGEGNSEVFGMRFDYTGSDNKLKLHGQSNTNSTIGPHFVVKRDNGQVAIGADNFGSGFELSVNGEIICSAISTTPIGMWPDYVFSSSYSLRPLDQVEAFIDENHHLPGIPSATEIDSTGVDLGEMNRLLLEKVEELTLYMIQQKEISDLLIKENQVLNARLDAIERRE